MYLRPSINELKGLQNEGVNMQDAHISATSGMRATLLLTISGLLALVNVVWLEYKRDNDVSVLL